MIRNHEDTDGICFGAVGSVATGAGCLILSAVNSECGTYNCPFYKPEACRDWIRLDQGDTVELIPPNEYRNKRW